MTTNFTEILTVLGTIIVTAGAAAAIIATLRSKLPQSTIDIQNESIAALERQNTMLKAEIVASVEDRAKQYAELMNLVTSLRARVEILETIPLVTMANSMKELVSTLTELRDIGHTNQALMQSLAKGGGNVTINK